MADGSIKIDLELLDSRAKKSMQEMEKTISEFGDELDDEMINKSLDFVNKWKRAELEYDNILSKMETNAKKLQKAIDYEIKMDQEHGVSSQQYQDAYEEMYKLQSEQEKLNLKLDQQIIKKDRIWLQSEKLLEQTIKQKEEELKKQKELEEQQLKADQQKQEALLKEAQLEEEKFKKLQEEMNLKEEQAYQEEQRIEKLKEEQEIQEWINEAIQERRNRYVDEEVVAERIRAIYDRFHESQQRINREFDIFSNISKDSPLQKWSKHQEFLNQQFKEMHQLAENVRWAIVETAIKTKNWVKDLFSLNTLKGVTKDIGSGLSKMHGKIINFNKELKNTEKQSSNVGNSFKNSAKSLFKLSLAMLGIRGVMTGLTKLTNEWYRSNDIGARQAQANMQAMTNGIVNLLAPALRLVTSLMATIMGYINAISIAFFGVNLLSKNVGKNIGSSASGAKKVTKELKKWKAGFDEADVASESISDNMDGGGGGGSGGFDLEPNIVTPDLSNFKKKLEELFSPFIKTIKSIDLEPLKQAFEQFGYSVVNILSIIGRSFVNVMNDSIAPFIKLMLEEIVPRFLVIFAEMLDMLAPYLQWFLTELIEPFINWLLLDLAPVWLETLARAFELLTPIVEAFLKALQNVWEDIQPIASFIAGVFVDAIEGLGEAFAELTDEVREDDSGLVEFFETVIKVVGAILIIQGVVSIFTGIMGLLSTAVSVATAIFSPLLAIVKVVAGFFAGAFAGSIGAIIALVVLLGTMFVGLITNFDQVKQDFSRIVENIKGIFKGLTNFIGGVFTGDWKRVWKGLVQIFANIIGGIANIFKFPINLMIDGLNTFIRGLNRIKIPSWVPGVGGKGINIGSIPRLASGATLTHQTVAMMAEYPNARTNPEIVSPERKMRQVFEETLASQGGTYGSEQKITVEIPLYLDGRQIHKVVKEIDVKEHLQRNGGGFAWNG